MRKQRFLPCSLALLGLWLAPGALLLTAREPAHRIHSDLRSERASILRDSVSPRLAAATDLGSVPATTPLTHITLHFQLTPAQQADLAALLKRQNDRTSRDFHRWLTPEQFASRYGLAESDIQKVTQWLQSNGFTVEATARSKTWIAFSGIAADVQNAFGTTLHRYSLAGVEHVANDTPLNLPTGLNGIVASVRGLHDFHPKPHLAVGRASRLEPRFTSNLSGNHFLTPDDFATIYDLKPLYNSGVNGAGQKIAVAGQTDVDLADIRTFRSLSGLPANDPQIVLGQTTDPGTSSADLREADLDIEWAGAVAPQATIVYVNSSDAFTSAFYAIDNNLAPVLSLSYGACEADFTAGELTTLSSIFQQGTAQGITTIAAGGDSGAADCDSPTSPTANPPASATHGPSVDAPGSIPYVTSLGGTTLSEGSGTYWSNTNNNSNGSALSYIPEVAWNDTALNGFLTASGGGRSAFFGKPSWQIGLNVPNDGFRDTPDVSVSTSADHDGYLICSGGTCVNGFRDSSQNLNVVGGASIAAPTFAGIVALLNQQTKTSHGNINPGLYSLASLSINAFHDITAGNNIVPCTAGSTGCPASGSFGFSAGPGYDQVTGLGSIDAYNLISQWGSDFSVTASPNTLTVNPGSSGSISIQVAKVANFTGVVSFTCTVPSALLRTTCSIPGTVTGSGTATLTVSNTASGSTNPPVHLPGSGPWWMLVAGLTGASLLYTFTARRRAPFALAGLTVALLVALTGCDDGGSSSVTQTQTMPSVTANVTVTATSGIENHATTVSVTVP